MDDHAANKHKARHLVRVGALSISQVLVKLKEETRFVSRAKLRPFLPRCCGSGARWRSGGRGAGCT
eukprot:1564302-Prorocentrum_lima.AAC.1